MALTPLADFSNTLLFTPTTGANVAKMKQLNNQYFVRKVSTWEEALACGAVLLVSGNHWIIMGARAAAHLHTQGLMPCTVRPAPNLTWNNEGLGLSALVPRVDPAYAITAAPNLSASFAGIVTRAHAILGWSGMLSNPFVKPPTMLNVITTMSISTMNGLNGESYLGENPYRDKPVIAEVAVLGHPFGVVELFNSPSVQTKLEEWDDAEEFHPTAKARTLARPNISPPSPLAHVWTPDFHYFGPGEPAEVRHLRAPRLGDTLADMTVFPAYPTSVTSWAAANDMRTPFNYYMPNGAQGEYNTNANVKTVTSLGGNVDNVMISNAQWAAPAQCYKEVPPVGKAIAYGARFVAASNGTVLELSNDVRPRLHKAVGDVVQVVFPWLKVCDPLWALFAPSSYYSLDAPFTALNAAGDGLSTGLGILCSEQILNRSDRSALVNTGVPETLSGKPALHVLGGTFMGSYYGTDLLRLPVTGIAIASQDLIQLSPTVVSVSFEQVPPNTDGMTPEQKESAERAAERAFAAWRRPGKTSIPTERAPERWIYSMMDAFGDLLTYYYDQIEALAKEKYD